MGEGIALKMYFGQRREKKVLNLSLEGTMKLPKYSFIVL